MAAELHACLLMKLRPSLSFLALWLFFGILPFSGCGRGEIPAPPPLPTPPPPPPPTALLTRVIGKAQFGSQCPLGFYAPPTKVPLELWTCPLGLDPVELQDPLTPLIFQVDCKKKTMDIRGIDRSSGSTTWEIMPDGSFFFKIDGGAAKLKNDGSGHKNCSIPLQANIWGKVDCKVRDQAVIQLDSIWWLGKQPEEPIPQASPSPSPVPSPVPSPGASASPSPSASPIPAASGTAGGSHPTSLSWSRAVVFTEDENPDESPINSPFGANPAESAPACQVPLGCYFHSATQIDQCL